MSKIEVNQIGPQCGTTVTVGCGAGQTVAVDAATVTLGRSGGTVSLTCGATQSGFGRTGTVDWVTAIKTTGFTAVSGEGYFCNTTSAGFTVTFPAASVGNIISISDYASTFATNNLLISPNGTDKIGGVNGMASLSTNGQSVTFIYADATKGWLIVQDSTETVTGSSKIFATGGCISTCGDCKVHKFTGPGTFCVSQVSPSAPENVVSYLVVAGGGGGGWRCGGGGGGAGGFREDKSPVTPYTASPLDGAGAITVSASPYSIAVGGGGAAASSKPGNGTVGNVSTFDSITSAGGGTGGGASSGGNGGSGGGGGNAGPSAGGTGNQPPVSPAQGFNGGSGNAGGGSYQETGGGGGGSTAVGACSSSNAAGGNGGNGATTSISGTPTAYGGGGGGGTGGNHGAPVGAGGSGGGGAGGNCQSGIAGVAGGCNTGGGGGAGAGGAPSCCSGWRIRRSNNKVQISIGYGKIKLWHQQ
jgi:hypothetical protein